MKSISLEEQRNPNFLNRDSNTNEIQTQCSVQCPYTEIYTFGAEQWYFVTKIVLTYCEKKLF